jgi:hypothetical protein
MGGLVYLVVYLPFINNALLLVVQVVVGTVVYLLMSIVFNPPAFPDAWEAIRHKIVFNKIQTRENNP